MRCDNAKDRALVRGLELSVAVSAAQWFQSGYTYNIPFNSLTARFGSSSLGAFHGPVGIQRTCLRNIACGRLAFRTSRRHLDQSNGGAWLGACFNGSL